MIRHLQGWRILWPSATVVAIGCALLLLADAPSRMPLMNAAALLIGICALAIVSVAGPRGANRKVTDSLMIGAAAAIFMTALFGAASDGVSRWLAIGSVTIQPALIIVPPLTIAFARHPSPRRSVAMMVAALGVALQPDPAAAAMLLLGVAIPMLVKRANLAATMTIAAAVVAFGAAILQNNSLPPVPYAEGMLSAYMQQGPLPAMLTIAGIVLLFLPALTAHYAGRRSAAAAFAGVWAGAVLASIVGPFPTPMLGYGGSFVLGYILSVGVAHGLTSRRGLFRSPRRAAALPADGASLELT